MSGKLTTHVLDMAHGRPAANLTIELWAIDAVTRQQTLLKTVCTNADGRTDAPLLTADELQVGVYQLVFAVGDYFAQQLMQSTPDRVIDAPTPPFLDRVPIQFGIADSNAHYHVPLLTSAWAYSTYRGS
jgi:5-hydroxyisourate hydrolase